MKYKAAIDWIYQQLPIFQQQGKKAFKPGLENIRNFVEHLGNPHQQFKSVHIGGTNGKGSVAHMLASVFQEAGYKTGVYSSPHLRDFRERIKINGQLIPKIVLTDFITENQTFITHQQCSFFELGVAMGFDYFAAEKVDIAFIEVGLGGRLDATNILSPELSIITNIGLDHTDFLGDTLSEIAIEKAGIIKPETPVIIGEDQEETHSVFRKRAKKQKSAIYFASNVKREPYDLDLLGNYQQKNAATVEMAVEILRKNNWFIKRTAFKKGLKRVQKNTGFIGRFSLLDKSPTIIADTAHNAEGMQWVIDQVKAMKFERLFIIIGMVKDKNTDRILPIMPQNAIYFFTQPNVPRRMEAENLAVLAKRYGLLGSVVPSVKTAQKQAKKQATEQDLILICGSTFTVAEIISDKEE